MADLTATEVLRTSERGRSVFPVADGVTLYPGSLVQIESGYLNHWDGSGLFVGLLTGGDEADADSGAIVGDATADPLRNGHVNDAGTTLRKVAVNGASQAAVGGRVFCPDSDPSNLTLDDGDGDPPIGLLTFYRTAADCDVRLFTPTEWAALTGWGA